MDSKNKNNRQLAIELLELSITKANCSIEQAEKTLAAMRTKQVNRIAELRLQQLIQKNQEWAAEKAARAAAESAQP